MALTHVPDHHDTGVWFKGALQNSVSQRKVVEAHVYQSSQTYDWKGFFPLKTLQLVWAVEEAEWLSPHYMKTPELRMTNLKRLPSSVTVMASPCSHSNTHTHTHATTTISCSKKWYWTRLERGLRCKTRAWTFQAWTT